MDGCENSREKEWCVYIYVCGIFLVAKPAATWCVGAFVDDVAMKLFTAANDGKGIDCKRYRF